MTVGKDVSSSVFEGRWRLCRGDVRRQAIPDSKCSHSEDSIADCFQSGMPDDHCSFWLDADRSRLRESSSTAHCKSLARYSGAVLLRQRNTRTTTADGTQYVLGCAAMQYRSRSIGVIWSYFRQLHTNLAAALSTDCRQSSIKRRGIPMRFTLP